MHITKTALLNGEFLWMVLSSGTPVNTLESGTVKSDESQIVRMVAQCMVDGNY